MFNSVLDAYAHSSSYNALIIMDISKNLQCKQYNLQSKTMFYTPVYTVS
jgi:hypothetical protein